MVRNLHCSRFCDSSILIRMGNRPRYGTAPQLLSKSGLSLDMRAPDGRASKIGQCPCPCRSGQNTRNAVCSDDLFRCAFCQLDPNLEISREELPSPSPSGVSRKRWRSFRNGRLCNVVAMVGGCHPNRGRVEATSSFFRGSIKLGSFVPCVPNCLADLPRLHLLSGIGPQQINRQMCRISRCQPSLVILSMKNHGHSIVYRLHQVIGICGENCVSSQLLPCRLVLPSLPESREREHGIVLRSDREWLLVLLVFLLPFVEPVGRYKAAPLSPRFAERRARCDSSDFALIVLKDAFPSFDQKGTSPHRMTINSRRPVSGRRHQQCCAHRHDFGRSFHRLHTSPYLRATTIKSSLFVSMLVAIGCIGGGHEPLFVPVSSRPIGV